MFIRCYNVHIKQYSATKIENIKHNQLNYTFVLFLYIATAFSNDIRPFVWRKETSYSDINPSNNARNDLAQVSYGADVGIVRWVNRKLFNMELLNMKRKKTTTTTHFDKSL